MGLILDGTGNSDGSGEARKESDGARLLGHGENTGAVSSSSGSGRLPVALVFGFLASYKLPELVVAAARRMKDCDVRFAFCVGFNRRARTRRYRRRYEALHRAVAELGEQASWCGYIPDERWQKCLLAPTCWYCRIRIVFPLVL